MTARNLFASIAYKQLLFMPVNLAAHKRHEIIDGCLRNKTVKWTKRKLCEIVNEKLEEYYGEPMNVSDRTVLKDLQDMQSAYGAPIDKRGSGNDISYYYSDTDFSITKLPLSENEVLRLNEAIHLLKQIKGFTIADEIAEVVQRLEKKIHIKAGTSKPVIAFENAPVATGTESLEDIYLAILNKSSLKITYQSFKQTESQVWIIHPYFLKEYNNRWFLIGLFDETKQLGTYALDRMKEIKVNNAPYVENTMFDADEYFKNIIGVTIMLDEPVEKVVLQVSALRAPYLLTKPLHLSQKVLKNDVDGLTIELSLIVNQELRSLLLSFGNDVEVMQPERLREQIGNCVREMEKIYGN